MKNSSDTIVNGTRDLPAYSAVPQPPTPPRAPRSSVACAKERPKHVARVRHQYRILLLCY
jgi:hypothetical protein